MSITQNIVIVKNPKDKKKGYLKLRTIINRKAKDKSLGYQILLKNWNSDKQQVTKKEPFYKEINERLLKVLANSSNKINLNSTGDTSFLNFAKMVTRSIPTNSTRKAKQDALNKFTKYINSIGYDDIRFAQIDVYFVQAYYSFLLGDMEIISANTYLNCLKYFVKQAIDGKKHHYEQHPFSTIKKQKVTKKYKVINNEELKVFMTYDNFTPKRKDVYEGFLFMMYAGGIRISDALLMRFENIEKHGDQFFLNYRVKKTGVQIQSKLTLKALIHLTHFMGRYGNDYKKLLHDYKTTKQILEAEYNSMDKPKQDNTTYNLYTQLFLIMQDAKDNELNHKELLRREMFKAKELNDISKRLKAIKLELKQHELVLTTKIGEALLELKDKYPTNTLMPYMNDIYDGEHILSDNQEQTLRKYKVHFNDQLRTITNHLDLNTKITPHMARHVFAQRLFLAGVNMHYISMSLGHTSLKTTESYREQLVTMESMDIIDKFATTLEDIGI